MGGKGTDNSALVGQLGFGGVCGVCTGVAAKKVGIQMAYYGGLAFVGLQTLAYMGYVKVDYLKMQSDATNLLDQNGDGKLDEQDAKIAADHAVAILKRGLPSAGGFSAG